MDENEMTEVSRTGFLLVTGCSSFGFSFIINILDGSHSRFLLQVGAITLSLGLLNWAVTMMIRQLQHDRKKEKKTFVSDEF